MKESTNDGFQTNRKWKYGGILIFKLTAIDFLFDRNTNYGSIRNRLQARNYFRFLADQEVLTLDDGIRENGFRAVHERLSDDYCQFWPKKPFTTKPEVEILQKLHTSTRNRRPPIRLQYNVRESTFGLLKPFPVKP